MAGERRSGRRNLALADDGLRTRVPMPQEHRAVGGPGGDVAVRRNVAFGPRQARHHAVVAEDDLHDLGGFGRENAEAVVPEAACDQELAVHGGHEAVGADLQVLAEVVAQVPPQHRVRAVVRHRCNASLN